MLSVMGWLSEGWVWLDANSRQIGALSSIAFGPSSAAVAWVAYRLNYRNNNGWPPVFLTSGAMMGELKKEGVFVGITFAGE